MSRDLDAQLEEMGSEYRAVVGRLRAGRTVCPSVACVGSRGIPGHRPAAWLAAASLLLVCGLSAVLFVRPVLRTAHPAPSFGAREYHQSVSEMIASQRSDGGWQNDFLTRRNAEVLRGSDRPEARVAYKRAVRNLRLKGLL